MPRIFAVPPFIAAARSKFPVAGFQRPATSDRRLVDAVRCLPAPSLGR